MRLFFRIILLVNITSYNLISQNRLNPLEIPILLSGTFGEFRKTHFHTGIDIKTLGKEGIKVRAIDDGDLIRAKVSTSGYGKVVYVRHYDGTTSVYAHLKRFSPKIEKIIKEIQYKKKRFEIEKFFQEGEVKIKKSEIIGSSGNTGGSSGPHLHFELRNTKNEKPLNPLKHGFFVLDTIPPTIQNIYIYKFLKKNASKRKRIALKKDKTLYTVIDTIKTNGMFGIGYTGYDKQNLSHNRNGIYKRELTINGEKVYSYKFDDLIFSDGKKINLLIDYEAYNIDKIRIKKLYQSIESEFSFLEKNKYNGLFKVVKDSIYNVKILFEDFNKNISEVKMVLVGKDKEDDLYFSKNEFNDNPYKPNKEYEVKYQLLNLKIPKDAFYEPTNLNFDYKLDTLVIEKFTKAPKKGLSLEFFLPKGLDSTTLRQICIGKFNFGRKNKIQYVFGKKNYGKIYAKNISEGKYFLTKDTKPPSIKPINFQNGKLVDNLSILKLRVNDNLSGIKKYNAYINGDWILMEHEPKRNLMFIEFSNLKSDDSKLELNLIVEDVVGNVNKFHASLYREIVN